MNDDENPIDKALNLASTSSAIAEIVAVAKNDSATEDFTFSRAKIRETVMSGAEALNKLAIVADQSQNPRAYEVLAKLMDSVVNASKQLIDMQVQIRTIEKADHPVNEDAKKHVTNNLFVGSTAELQKILSDMNNNDKV